MKKLTLTYSVLRHIIHGDVIHYGVVTSVLELFHNDIKKFIFFTFHLTLVED